MKRLVSSILTLAMVLSLAGCSKKSEETTKKKKEKTETESEETLPPESDTEETNESEETEDTTESSEAEESTKASGSNASDIAGYTISPNFSIRSDLENLDYSIISDYRAYGFPSPNDDIEINKLVKRVDMLTVNDADTYSQLWNSLDGIFPSINSDLDDIFDQKLPSYVDNTAAGSFTVDCKTFVTRADSEVFSFVTCRNAYDVASDSYSTVYRTYNYRSSDAMEYNLNDIVSDRGGFANFFAEYLENALKDDVTSMRRVEYLAGLISDPNENIPFLLTYDGIYIIDTEDSTFCMFKIPAVYAEDYFDMSLFGATPEYYVLQSDAYDHIIWDVDGDGALDNISVVAEKDEYNSLIGLGISVNGNVEQLPNSELQYFGMGFYGFYLLKTDEGFYVYAEMYTESADTVVEVFKYDGSSFKFQASFTKNLPMMSLDGFFYDPANFTVSSDTDIMGSGYVVDSVSAIGSDGMPVKTIDMGSKYQIVATKQEITVNRINNKGSLDGTATLPENTVFSVIGIDLDTRTLLCEYLDAEKSKNFYFQLQADPAQGDSDWIIRFNGIEQDELFRGYYYAG